jgi:predicted translin family RNA/ssDNA-binding protein
MWPELKKAMQNARSIENEINTLLKNHNSFGKREISRQNDTLLAETEAAMERIEKEIESLKRNMASHEKYIGSKSRFLKRHYRRI